MVNQMSVSVNLASLNALRIDLGMSPLKSWKDSGAKLQIAIEKLEAKKAAAAGPSIIQKQVEEHKAAVDKIARKANVPVKNVEATVTRLAKELGDKQRKTRNAAQKEKPAMKMIKDNMSKKAAVKNGKNLKAHKTGAINVADIASELGINAKVARATLRRKGIDRTDEKAIRQALAKK